MNLEKQEKELLQWHPAFYAGLQIELQEDLDNLIFENEHQLSTKPMEIDVLVVKKEKALPVKKNIGHIFRMHNIVEYKSPTDYLSIDDFYKVYGYACFYKAAMDIIVRANSETFKEVKAMCEALKELMKDELDAAREDGLRQGQELGMRQGQERLDRVNALTQHLLKANRTDDLLRSTTDETYQEQLFEEFGL